MTSWRGQPTNDRRAWIKTFPAETANATARRLQEQAPARDYSIGAGANPTYAACAIARSIA
jgi:hypothetical protein